MQTTESLSQEVSRLLSTVVKKWPILKDDVDRGHAVKVAHDKGVTYRLLAEKLHCSPSKLRHLKAAADAALVDRVRGINEKISTRELIRRSKAAQAAKKAAKKAAEEKARADQRALEAREGAKRIREWLNSEQFDCASTVCEQMVDEARRILHKAEQDGTLAKAASVPSGVPVDEIIRRCRPKQQPGEFFVAYYADWLANWSFCAFPDPIVRWQALGRAQSGNI